MSALPDRASRQRRRADGRKMKEGNRSRANRDRRKSREQKITKTVPRADGGGGVGGGARGTAVTKLRPSRSLGFSLLAAIVTVSLLMFPRSKRSLRTASRD